MAKKPKIESYIHEIKIIFGDYELDTKSGAGLILQDFLDSVPFYALIIDEDHIILMANKAVTDQLGLDPKKIIDNYCPLVIHGSNKAIPHCPLEDAIKENRSIEREVYDPEYKRWMNTKIYYTNCKTQKGKKVFLHIAIDITDQKKAQGFVPPE